MLFTLTLGYVQTCMCSSVSVEASVFKCKCRNVSVQVQVWKCHCVSVSVEVSVFKGFSGRTPSHHCVNSPWLAHHSRICCTNFEIPDAVQQALLDEQHDLETFGLLALSLTELVSALDSMGLDIAPRVRSSLRVLWTRCQPAAASGFLAHASSIPTSGDSLDLSSGSRASSSWNEPFPAKLSPDLIR